MPITDSLKAILQDEGLEKKLFFGILFSGLAWISYEAYAVYSINKQRHKNLRPTIHLEEGHEQCLEISGSLDNKPRQVVTLFVSKIAKDEVLSKFFHPRTLQPHSLYAVILEKYMTEAILDGKDPVMPLNMKDIHKGIRIRKEHFDKWAKLWRESEKEVGVETRPDLWKDFESKLVTDK